MVMGRDGDGDMENMAMGMEMGMGMDMGMGMEMMDMGLLLRRIMMGSCGKNSKSCVFGYQ